MSCDNYNPIAAAAAPDTVSVPYESALVAQNCWCCEVGSVYSVFGGGFDPGPMCDDARRHLDIITPTP